MMTVSIPDNPDALLPRNRAAETLTLAGFPISAKTLSTKASRGGGPPYRLFGPRVLYRWADALAWAEARLTSPRRSTSEHDANNGGRFGIAQRASTRPSSVSEAVEVGQ
jgi:hypothetical protein